MTASFKKAFPWVPVKDSAGEGGASVVTAGTGPGKGESQLSGASDVTPSTSLARPPKTSSSVPCIHKGQNSLVLKTFWLHCSTIAFEICCSVTAQEVVPAPRTPWSSVEMEKARAHPSLVHAAFSSPDQTPWFL